MTGRNDPCSCGSGKKFKKCCGRNGVVSSIGHLLAEELRDVQKAMLTYTEEVAGMRLEREYQELLKQYPNLNKLETMGEIFYRYWVICVERDKDGKTLMDYFIEEFSAEIPRERTRNIVRSWQGQAQFVSGAIEEIEEEAIIVRDVLTSQSVRIAEREETLEVGCYLHGIILPYEQQAIFLMIPFTQEPGLSPVWEKQIKNAFKHSPYSSPQAFLKEKYVEMVNELYQEEEWIEWEDPRHQEVHERFTAFMKEQGVDAETIEEATAFWWAFCKENHPKPRNTGIFAAAVYYLFAAEMERVPYWSQKKLAAVFGASANSISVRTEELADFLYETAQTMPPETSSPMLASERALWEMTMKIEDQGAESIEEVQQVMNRAAHKPFKPQTDEQRAQMMLYDAYEAEGPIRREMARRALELDPDAADAYTIFTEFAGETEQWEFYLIQAIEAGKRKLGDDFFKENEGHFWGIVSTRPFMRAKQNYAMFLEAHQRFSEAVYQLEDLIRLNPNDNQGNRDILIELYIRLEKWAKAEKLLNEYIGGFIGEGYHRTLVELLKNGITEKAKHLWRKALVELPDAVPYLKGEKPLPSLPDFYQKGTESEAVVYASRNIDFWVDSGAYRYLSKL
ncbi:SEC-C metal-binding domain-containing protein [Domibacillus sp. DTU_2020_1001157_1_SI_ALB_TIR_016]|uniref:SEC-C metal-binding domain-containing protein n=1 Tax=Domibacillus sp. DTU_2020_1001157_1_SI_ALB_TIR_016 TaxID=3077789 RepID=UPI0028EB3CD5|nr:SEC-C metal-binding domain-containing protein [Domibacillus sp. DTU_2020_1001157_1_SI_ALB_TIR_016]WNS81307.1 SEC-C metal-binding domain-containing protein [Domibacillus sp. DTU_2020_1001157_1_SI_ALB_TIR_016]